MEYLWFFDTLVTVRVSSDAGADRIALLEHRARFGDSPPLHVHHTEDEGFCLLAGEMRLQVAGGEQLLRAGEMVLAPTTAHWTELRRPNLARADPRCWSLDRPT